MDRVTEYFGALVRETDGLTSQQNAVTGLGYASQAMLGVSATLDGFACAPTGPASLSVNLSPGSIYSLQSVEATSWSSLPANTAEQIMKQGIMHLVDNISINPPGTVGFSQNFLIEIQYADLDTTPVLLPYFNASNPAQPFSGPGNNGISQNTARLGLAAVQIKAGAAATTGTQTTPTPDAGWTGAWVVTMANGQTTITSGNISAYSPSAFIDAGAKLPAIPASIQNSKWTAFADTGSADALVITPSPAISAYSTNQLFIVKKGSSANATTTPTINISGFGNKTIVDRRGNAIVAGDLPASAELMLMYDGTNFRNLGIVAADMGATNSLYNVQQFSTTTRVSMAGNAGNSYAVTPWSPGNYVKKSATSLLVVIASLPTGSSSATNCTALKINVGSANLQIPVSNNITGIVAAPTVLITTFAGLGAGSQAVSAVFSRSDSSAWTTSLCPTSSDQSFLPASTSASIIIGELGV